MLNEKLAIQDTYGERFQYCWGCGPKNTQGLHLKSYPSDDGLTCYMAISPPEQYTGGVPDKLFGGMIAMILDCHGTASAAWFAHKAKGLLLSKEEPIERFITARLEIDYKAPTPMDTALTVQASLEELTDRKAVIQLRLEADHVVRATARMIAVKAKDEM